MLLVRDRFYLYDQSSHNLHQTHSLGDARGSGSGPVSFASDNEEADLTLSPTDNWDFIYLLTIIDGSRQSIDLDSLSLVIDKIKIIVFVLCDCASICTFWWWKV